MEEQFSFSALLAVFLGLWGDPGENPQMEPKAEPCIEAQKRLQQQKKTQNIELCICLLGAIFFIYCIFETL